MKSLVVRVYVNISHFIFSFETTGKVCNTFTFLMFPKSDIDLDNRLGTSVYISELLGVWMSNFTFKYISALSWQSALLVEETGVPVNTINL